MTARNPTYLKARWEQNDIPQGADYEDLFDSYVNFATSAEQVLDSNLRTTKKFVAPTVSAGTVTASVASVTRLNAVDVSASGRITASAANIGTVSADNAYLGSVFMNAVDVTALATTQAGAIEVSAALTFVIQADGNNTAIRLSPSVRGRERKIVNAASTTIKIFPEVSGRFLVTAVNASLNIPADRVAIVLDKGDQRYGISIAGF